VISDNAIDCAIDEAVRQIADGEPPADFHIRVIERLHESGRRWPSGWLLSPIAIAAAVLLAWSLRTPTPQPRAVAVLSARTISVTTELPNHERRTLTTALIAAPPLTSPDAGLSVVAALAPPELEVPSLALSAMPRGESIAVPELETIAPITVAPIGDPQGERR
jgi:hypothetical protein